MEHSNAYVAIMGAIKNNQGDLTTDEADEIVDYMKKVRKPQINAHRRFLLEGIPCGRLRWYIERSRCICEHIDDEFLKFCPKIRQNLGSLDMWLVSFDQGTYSTNYVLAEMNKLNLRPATLEEMLWLCIQEPEVLEYALPRPKNVLIQQSLVALGSIWKREGKYDEVSPIIMGQILREVFLSTTYIKGPWGPSVNFVAVKNS